uniref:non-specific serine/threonine protein kinase n=1 Tax=Aegilops tauschii subsp. strangulata TaxID=200361 RepID=A0A453Q780_AEGTS
MDDDQARELRALERILSDPSVEPTMLSYGILKYITNSFSNEIGRGGFGVVYQGDLENWVVAVKIFKTHNADRQFLDEIRCLKIANHKNIVRFLGYCSDIQEEVRTSDGVPVLAGHYKRLLCFEYVPKGNIRQYLQQEKPHQEDWPARYKMIRGICQGLHYLHDKQIIHRDLKPENVMLDAQMEPKITDFGLSRFLDQGTSTLLTSHIAGTLRYIAPESKDNGEVSLKSDIYALGVIMVELLSGMSMISLLHQWDKYIDMSLPRVRGCTELARNCMDQDKHQRPTVREVIRDLDNLESMFPWSSISQSRPMGPESTVVKLPSRSLTIAWVDNPEYWRWTSRRDSRFTGPSLKETFHVF